MKDVTSYFNGYKDASRFLRNVFYKPTGTNDWDMVDEYLEMDRLLFRHQCVQRLALNPASLAWLTEPAPMFALRLATDSVPVAINRGGQSGYWDHSIDRLGKGDARVCFISYFDWDQMGHIDFRYVRGRILESIYPAIKDHDVLIESQYVTVDLDPDRC